MVAANGGEPTDEVGDIGLDGARDRLGVRWKEVGADDDWTQLMSYCYARL